MDITINLTEQQVKFLKLFASNHHPNAKDNVGTYNPIHVVQTRRERIVDPDYDSPDEIFYLLNSRYEEKFENVEALVRASWECKECPIDIVSFDEAYDAETFIGVDEEEHVVYDGESYLEAYGMDKEDYKIVNVEYFYEDVAFFFILSEAKEYMKYQSHNLNHPRTYTYGAGYSNKGEYHHFWQLLFDLGKDLVRSELKKEGY